MPGPITIERFTRALARLFPQGPIWPQRDELPPVLGGLLQGISVEAVRVCDGVAELVRESHPWEASSTLADWEAWFGLSSSGLTEDERRLQLVNAVLARGDNSYLGVSDLPTLFGLPQAAVVQGFHPLQAGDEPGCGIDGHTATWSPFVFVFGYQDGGVAIEPANAWSLTAITKTALTTQPYHPDQASDGKLTTTGGGAQAILPLGWTAGVGEWIRVTCYLKLESGGPVDIYHGAAGTDWISTWSTDRTGFWLRFEHVSQAVSDGSVLVFDLPHPTVLSVWNVRAHRVVPELEALVRASTPVHTHAWFRPLGDPYWGTSNMFVLSDEEGEYYLADEDGLVIGGP